MKTRGRVHRRSAKGTPNTEQIRNIDNYSDFIGYISPLICYGHVLGVLQPINNEQRSRNARGNVIVGLDTEYPRMESQRCSEVSESKHDD